MPFQYWIIAIFCLTALIVVHEYGHFIVARLFDVKVIRFSVGFGKVLFSYKVKNTDTEFAVSLIPLGGYVSMLSKSNVTTEADVPHCLESKPIWQRTLIILAGPAANLLLAVILFATAAITGMPSIAPIIERAIPYSPAYKAGIANNQEIIAVNSYKTSSWQAVIAEIQHSIDSQQESILIQTQDFNYETKTLSSNYNKYEVLLPRTINQHTLLTDIGLQIYVPKTPAHISKVIIPQSQLLAGDHILEFNGQIITDWHDFAEMIKQNPDNVAQLLINRNNQQILLEVQIGHKMLADKKIGYLGVHPVQTNWTALHRSYSMDVLNALHYSIDKTIDSTLMILDALYKLFTGNAQIDDIAGPIGISKIMSQASQQSVGYLMIILGLLSMNLFLLNLLPVPVLDGGHLVYLVVEKIGGVKLANLVKNISLPIGLFIILVITAFTIFNDLSNL